MREWIYCTLGVVVVAPLVLLLGGAFITEVKNEWAIRHCLAVEKTGFTVNPRTFGWSGDPERCESLLITCRRRAPCDFDAFWPQRLERYALMDACWVGAKNEADHRWCWHTWDPHASLVTQ
jgi:hypothetical protein